MAVILGLGLGVASYIALMTRFIIDAKALGAKDLRDYSSWNFLFFDRVKFTTETGERYAFNSWQDRIVFDVKKNFHPSDLPRLTQRNNCVRRQK